MSKPKVTVVRNHYLRPHEEEALRLKREPILFRVTPESEIISATWKSDLVLTWINILFLFTDGDLSATLFMAIAVLSHPNGF